MRSDLLHSPHHCKEAESAAALLLELLITHLLSCDIANYNIMTPSAQMMQKAAAALGLEFLSLVAERVMCLCCV
jgi:hypothetical protein